MSTTTGHKEAGWGRILFVSVAIQAAGLAVFYHADFLRISTLTPQSQEARQLDEAAKDRLRRIEEEKRVERERRQLDPEQVRRIRDERAKKRTGDMQERVEDMKRWRDAAREAAQRQRNLIEKRTLEDIGREFLLQLQPLATQLVANASNQQAMMNLPAAPQVVKAAQDLQEFLQAAGDTVLATNNWTALKDLEQRVRNEQQQFIGQLDQQQAAYAGDLPRLQAENHAEYLVNLANNTMADLMRARQGIDPETMNRAPPDPSTREQVQGAPLAADDPVRRLHQEAMQVFEETQRHYAMARAVDTALQQQTALTDALSGAELPAPATRYAPGTTSGAPATLGDLNQADRDLDDATGDVQALWERTRNMASAAMGIAGMGDDGSGGAGNPRITPANAPIAARAAHDSAGRYTDMTVFFLDGGDGEKGFSGSGRGGLDITRRSVRTGFAETGAGTPGAREAVLAESTVLREALPGRVIDPGNPRHGWLYIDTWYVIGPWENHGNIRFAERHPPETLVDLDATYPGKDGRTLRWQFHQSDNIRIKPPDETEQSTYYGYTEVYSKEATEVLIAIASDDAARVWLNGLLVWDEDNGNSPWRLDEGFRRVVLRKGFNNILLRIENGPITCTYSLLLCPPDVLVQ